VLRGDIQAMLGEMGSGIPEPEPDQPEPEQDGPA